MGTHIKRDQDRVTVTVIGGSASKEVSFDRANWLSSCEIISELLQEILAREADCRTYREKIARQTRKKT